MKEEIIIKFLNGECTSEELRWVKEWQKNPHFKKGFEAIMEERWNQTNLLGSTVTNNEKLPRKIQEIIQNESYVNKSSLPLKKEIRFDLSYYLRVAAVLLIFIFSFFVTFYLFNNEATENDIVVEIKQIKKEASIGQKLSIQLPDGSKVVLNSCSSLSFPEKFNDTLRLVQLIGEAFFEVTSEASRPFKVFTNSATTTVLGTSFNINDRGEGARVILTEGKVKVESPNLSENNKNVFLSPGEMAIVNALEGDLVVEQVDVHEQTAWQRGVILFKNKPLNDIFSQLEIWYNVDFEISKKINHNSKVSGEFANENLENILSGLSFSFDFQYAISGNKVKIF
ncbi:MAG: FecR domain-containing protein [Bacteroidota bacterium]|nr:FecR domain-containing protein [Bacteroidota bacterium]